ncbi:L,D-transpeptidase [Phyllobacterium sp. UNC302MFCol5.2]|uniref:L,D-transpeptidase n=1 Tax=Phyllobacterium sp. UNC302MFCol5.2 TaxID=1449065 RepID=UPI000488CA70|nr:L,D-transpeptidase [Phyllobacterium sp. UNC302MFCol5.2]
MNDVKIARRGLLMSGLALMAAGCTPISFAYPVGGGGTYYLEPRLRRQRVAYTGGEAPGSLVINTDERYLYAVEGDGSAMRYGIAVGQEGLTLKGRAEVGRKQEWPSWTPTASMIQRKPRLAQYAGGVPGGPENPLGSRALYLYQNGKDTLFRVHGTNEPWLIGQAVSNGCIRLTNEDVEYLYDATPVGTPVLII